MSTVYYLDAVPSGSLQTDPPADGSFDATMGVGETVDALRLSPTGEPGADGVTGDYAAALVISSASNDHVVSVQWERINSTGNPQASSGFTAEQSSAVGTLNFSMTSVDLGVWASGDRLRLTVRTRDTRTMGGGTRTTTYDVGSAGSTTTAPWSEAPQPVVITLSPASVTASAVPANPQTAFSFADAIIPNRGPSRVGPFQSVAGDFYTIVLRKSDKKDLGAMKSSDPSVSWGNVGSNMSYGQEIRCVWVLQEADLLHVILQISSVGNNTFYSLFNMETDQWDISQEQVPNLEGSSAPIFGCSIARSPAGETLIAFMAGREGPIGIMALNTRSGGSWGAAGKMFLGPDTHGQLHRGASANQMIFRDPGLGGWSTARQASEPIELIDGNDSEDPHSGAGVRYLDGSTIRIAFPYARGGDGKVGVGRGVPGETGAGTWFNAGDVSGLPVKILSLTPIACIAVHGTDLHLLYADATGSNLHHLTSDDAGITWGSETEIEVGTANAVSAHLLDRGDSVIGYLWDNNGTLTYGEVSLAEGAVIISASPAALSLSAQPTVVLVPVVIGATPAALTTSAQAGSPVLGAKQAVASPGTTSVQAQTPTIVLGSLAFASSPAPIVVSAQAPTVLATVAVVASPAQLATAAQAPQVGASVAITASPAAIAMAAQAPTISLTAKAVEGGAASVATNAQAAAPAMGQLAVTAAPVDIATEAQVAQSGASASISASPATLTASAQAPQVDIAAVVEGSPATLATTAQPPSVTGGGAAIAASPANLTAQAQGAVVTPTALVATGAPATISTQGQAPNVALGQKQVSATPATLTTSAQAASVQSSGAVSASPATLSTTAQPADIVMGQAAIEASPATVNTAAQAPTIFRDQVIVTAEPASLTANASVGLVALTGVVVEPNPAEVATQAQPPLVDRAVTAVSGSPAELNTAAQAAAVALQPFAVLASPALVAVDGQEPLVSSTGAIVTATPATINVSAQEADLALVGLVVEAVPAFVQTGASAGDLGLEVLIQASPVAMTVVADHSFPPMMVRGPGTTLPGRIRGKVLVVTPKEGHADHL